MGADSKMWEEFIVMVCINNATPHIPVPLCGLCGNTGYIAVITPFPPCGLPPGHHRPTVQGPCICPNGRAEKK